jgi:SAM-dependent methyltransferase
MKDPARGNGEAPKDSAGNNALADRKDFWSEENLNFSKPWYRLEKSARIIKRLARGRECTLLDIGCGPATLMRLLPSNVQYHGIDIAIHDPAPNLIEADIVESPIGFHGKRFDIVIAQGIFEYVGNCQAQKFAEVAQLLKENGIFIATYWNFGHRKTYVYDAFSNIRTLSEFRRDLETYFTIDRFFPTSHNWGHGEPNRKLIKALNMHMNVNIPLISPALAVEYYFICSARRSSERTVSSV